MGLGGIINKYGMLKEEMEIKKIFTIWNAGQGLSI